MLKNFKNWLLENKYSELTSTDYMGRIERLCRKEGFTLAHLVIVLLPYVLILYIMYLLPLFLALIMKIFLL